MDYIGRSPIWPPLLILGKVALFASCLFPFAGFLQVGSPIYESTGLRIIGLLLLLSGAVLLVAAIGTLGRSVAVGFPDRNTELRTTGLYRFTRNPIYLGAFTMCTGSCLMALYPANLFLVVIAVAIHHRIIRREELFLAERFGAEWTAYCRKTPRYLL